MFAEERRSEIIQLLSENKKVAVKELSKIFQVSEVIIRKDLKKLEAEGNLKRTHGGAIISQKRQMYSPMNNIKFKTNDGNKRVARKAYNEIRDGDVVFFDSSNINLLISSILMECPKKITIISNMLQIIKMLAGIKDVNLISIGGTYELEHDYFTGGMAIESIKKLNVDKLFMEMIGINIFKNTLSDASVEDGFLKKNLMEVSKKVYFLSPKKKFDAQELYNFGTLQDIDAVIVDGKLDEELIRVLQENHIQII